MSSNLEDSSKMLTSYYDEKWPEKMVILITSHGSFSRKGVETDSEIKTMKVPSGIKVNYLYSSSHGGVTAYMENGAKRMFDFTKTHIPQLLSDNPDDTKSALSQYSNIMMKVKDEAIDSVLNDIKNYKQLLENSSKMYNTHTNTHKKYREQINEMSKYLVSFVHDNNKCKQMLNTSYSKGFTYKTYNPNESMPNKRFNRDVTDIYNGKTVDAQKYNYAIRLMNLKNQPDILDLLQSTRYRKRDMFGADNTPNITTQQMVEMCIQHGVKEITIIDSACGSIDGTHREVRHIRRNINREPNFEFLLNTKTAGASNHARRRYRASRASKNKLNYLI